MAIITEYKCDSCLKEHGFKPSKPVATEVKEPTIEDHLRKVIDLLGVATLEDLNNGS